MRIAWVTTGISANEKDYAGAASITKLVQELSAYSDLEVIVFSLYYPLNQHYYKLFNTKIYSFGKALKLNWLKKVIARHRCIKRFRQEHRQKGFDLVHSMWSGESGYIASRLSKKLNIPMITNVNGGELGEIKEIKFGSQLKFFQRFFVGKAFRQAKVIVCGSDFITSKVKEVYSSEIGAKVKKISFGIDETIFKPSPPGPPSFRREGVFSIISIANAFPVKSHVDLFKAFKIVLQKFPDARLLCFGLDEKNILFKMADKLGLSGNVEIKGFAEYESIPEVLKSGHVFVSSSLYESQNMAILEAAFCGLPVVSTSVGIAPEITDNIVKAGDFEALAGKIIYVIENYIEESKTAEDNVRALRERFSLKASGRKFYDLYKSFLHH